MEEMTNFDEYVEKYCRTYRVTHEEALKHELVRLVKEHYETK